MCRRPLELLAPPPPRLDWRALVALCLANCAHFYAIASIFSYAGFLAVDLGWAVDEDSAGFVVGLLPTMLLLGRLPTCVVWGMAADYIGRRPALLFSMGSIALGNVCFGLSTNLAAALASRFFLFGCGSGFVSLMGLLSLEIGGPKRQAEVFSWAISAGSLISMLGPALGGITYGTLTSQFPALAPSLIGFVMALAAIVATLAWMPETGRPRWRGCTCLPTSRRGDQLAAVLPSVVPNSSIDPDAEETFRSRSLEGAKDGGGKRSGTVWSIMLQWPMPLALLLRTGHGMTMFAIYDVVPLWCIASRGAGGLSYTEEQVGALLGIAAAGQVLYTCVCMGRMVNLLGHRLALVLGCAVAALSLGALPFVAMLSEELGPAATMVIAAVVYCVHCVAMLTAGTGVVAMTTTLCAGFPERSGQLNGVVAMTEGIGKMAGPAIAAPVFAWAIARMPGSTIPDGAQLVFIGFGAVFVGLALLGTLLPHEMDSVAFAMSCEARQRSHQTVEQSHP